MNAGSDPLDKKVKEFSVGLLENPVNHEWSSILKKGRVNAVDSLSIAGSLFLFRKALPVLPSDPSLQRLRITAPPLDVDQDYFGFLRKLVNQLFPIGWDRGFERAVENFTPNVSACWEESRSQGGVRKQWAGRREEFIEGFALDLVPSNSLHCRYANVNTGGKSRGVTVNPSDHLWAGPVHKVLYDHISTKDWLLRGEAKPGKFSAFSQKPGEVFVSGDYSAATDNLSLEVAEQLLALIFCRCRHIPVSSQLACFRSLRANVWYDDCSEPFVQTRGQLMGSFLSFPLLCLQNYAAFRYLVPRQGVPVKINGDDIVFRATPDECQRWKEGCPRFGLDVHPTKTMVHRRFFSLNSTFFESRRGKIGLIPVVRMGTLQKPVETPTALAGGYRSFCAGFRGEAAEMARRVYLSRRLPAIRASGRSMMALGIRASPEVLGHVGLYRRECWFSNLSRLGVNVERRLPVAPERVKWAGVPPGWVRGVAPSSKRKRRAARKCEEDFWREVVDRAWLPGVVQPRRSVEAHWREVRLSGLEGAYADWRRRSKGPMRKVLRRFCSHGSNAHDVSCDPFHLSVGPRLRENWWQPKEKPILIWVKREAEPCLRARVVFG
nr:RdRp [Botryosphaeria dothidea ourmia-like virus 2]